MTGFTGNSLALAGLDDVIRDMASGGNGLLLSLPFGAQLIKTAGSNIVEGELGSGVRTLVVGDAVQIGHEIFYIVSIDGSETMTVDREAVFTEGAFAYIDPAIMSSINNGAGRAISTVTPAGVLTVPSIVADSVAVGAITVSGTWDVDGATTLDQTTISTIDGAFLCSGPNNATINVSGTTLINGDANVTVSTNNELTLASSDNIDIDAVNEITIDTTNGPIDVGVGSSGTAINIGHTTSEVTVNDNLNVSGDLIVAGTVTSAGSGVTALAEPFVIANRGSPRARFENSIPGFDYVIDRGSLVIGLEVRTLRDDGLAVMHDSTVDRTTTGTGSVSQLLSTEFTALVMDDTTYVTDYNIVGTVNPPLLIDLFRRYGSSVWYVIEDKDTFSSMAIVALAIKYGLSRRIILACSTLSRLTDVYALYPYVLLMYISDVVTDFLALILAGITYLGHSSAKGSTYVASAFLTGLKPVVYTLNTQFDFGTYTAYGISGCWSDAPIYVENLHKKLVSDPWDSDLYYPGQIITRQNLFSTVDLDGTGIVMTDTDTMTALQGWMCPNSVTVDYIIDVYFDILTLDAATTWIGIAISNTDTFTDNTSPAGNHAYHFITRKTGIKSEVFEVTNGSAVSLDSDNTGTEAIQAGYSGRFSVEVTAATLVCTTTITGGANNSLSVTATDTTGRGEYIFLTTNGKSGNCSIRFKTMSRSIII